MSLYVFVDGGELNGRQIWEGEWANKRYVDGCCGYMRTDDVYALRISLTYAETEYEFVWIFKNTMCPQRMR